MPEISRLVKIILVLAYLSLAVSACFITDCPARGKRNSKQAWSHLARPLKQCPSCGPSVNSNEYSKNSLKQLLFNQLPGEPDYRCFGPNLCCSKTEGCLPVESPEAQMCAFEDVDPTPCRNDAPDCSSAGEGGQCVTEGICCTPKGECQLDPVCFSRNVFGSSKLGAIFPNLAKRSKERSFRRAPAIDKSRARKSESPSNEDWSYNEDSSDYPLPQI